MSRDEERKFLHELANPLSIVHGNLKLALRKLQVLQNENASLRPREFHERLQKAMEACERAVAMLVERRKTLQQDDSQVAS
jgi:hypothetical protein